LSPQGAWLPERPLWWGFSFALLFVLLHGLTTLLGPVVDIVPGKVSLIYLPAFARVVSVVVAGAAGAAGIAAGSLFLSLYIYDTSAVEAFSIAAASSLGILTAYWVLRHAMATPKLPIRLSSLMVLTGLYCTFNAIFHGLIWDFFLMVDDLTPKELTFMILGDFLGVVVMFAALRFAVRLFRRFNSGSDTSSGSLT